MATVQLLPFSEARAFVRRLNLRSRAEWLRYCADDMPHLPARPANLPNLPERIHAYRNEWRGWSDWLGIDPAVSPPPAMPRRARKSSPSTMLNIEIKKLFEDAPLPERATAQAAGYDARAYIGDKKPITILPRTAHRIGTGLSMAIPPGFECQVRPRSGLAFKHGVTVLNAPGTIDADFRGEVGVLLVNHSDEPFVVNHGDRIAQFVFAAVATVEFTVAVALSDTARKDGGWGHSGKA